MNYDDFPALYKSADALSAKAQQVFFGAILVHLVLLVMAAALSAANIPTLESALGQLILLITVVLCSAFLLIRRPERGWYEGRAVAESVKTMTWRFISRAEPYNEEDNLSSNIFLQRLSDILKSNKHLVKNIAINSGSSQISQNMLSLRSKSLDERKKNYLDLRISDQLDWYSSKGAENKKYSNFCLWALLAINITAVAFAITKLYFPDAKFWPTDIIIAASASVLAWMQAKRYSELATSYCLAAHEISIISSLASNTMNETEFSSFVADTESAFSREHTQWIARRDA